MTEKLNIGAEVSKLAERTKAALGDRAKLEEIRADLDALDDQLATMHAADAKRLGPEHLDEVGRVYLKSFDLTGKLGAQLDKLIAAAPAKPPPPRAEDRITPTPPSAPGTPPPTGGPIPYFFEPTPVPDALSPETLSRWLDEVARDLRTGMAACGTLADQREVLRVQRRTLADAKKVLSANRQRENDKLTNNRAAMNFGISAVSAIAGGSRGGRVMRSAGNSAMTGERTRIAERYRAGNQAIDKRSQHWRGIADEMTAVLKANRQAPPVSMKK